MQTELLEELSILSGILSIVLIILFIRLNNNVSKIKDQLAYKTGQDLLFKAKAAEFRRDPDKLNYFMDYICYIHLTSNLSKELKTTRIKTYTDKLKNMGAEDFIPDEIKMEYDI